MPSEASGGVVRIGEWLADPALDTLSRGAETHKLEPRTMRLLVYLADSAGKVVSVDQLLTEVWSGVVVGSASVYQAVSQLRKLLGDTDPNPTYIATVPRKGYRLIAPVSRVEPVIAAASPIPAAAPADAAPVSTPAAALSPARRHRAKPLVLLGAALVAVVALGTALWKRLHPPERAADAASIVVLPFVDMTAERTDQAFCDGLTEELSNWLAQIPTLRVVARTSAFAFRGQGEDVRKIGRELGTNRILEGSMRRSGDHLRITVQLIDARNGYHLWSQNFDRPLEDAINVQEDISRSVAAIMKVRLSSDSDRQFAARRTADSQAYQLYLLGRHYSQILTPDSTDRAIDLYRQVLAADPNFAPAYTQLAYARLNQAYLRDLPIAAVAPDVEPLIESALRLDNRMSAAFAVRGTLRAIQLRTSEALEDLQRAVALNPSDMGALAEIGRIHLVYGQPRESLASYDHAAELDPLNYVVQEQRCTVLTDLARYAEAANACTRARVLQPAAASPADRLAWLAEARGRIDEALRWNDSALKIEPNDEFDMYWARATYYLTLGDAASARAAVEKGRTATHDEIADAALVRVAYREGGVDALRRQLDATHLDQSPLSVALFEAAYAQLLLGNAAAVKDLIARARAAPDVIPGFAELPWYARGDRSMGTSYRIDLAAAELELGDKAAAAKELQTVGAMIDRMVAAGVERYATYELRARVHALLGQGDEAMQDLGKAVQLGWRRSWWAIHEPYFASLQSRSDFQALMSRVNQSNDTLAKRIERD